MLNIALVGIGKWGKNYYRILCELHQKKNINFKYISKNNHKKINSKKFSKDIVSLENLFKKKIDLIIISTPPQTHYEILKKSINHNIPVLVEKPLTLGLKQAENIRDLIVKKKSIFFVNYQYLVSPYFIELKNLVNKKKIKSIYSEGHGIGPKRDYSVLWDWAPHDLSMIFNLLGMKENYEIYKVRKSFAKNNTSNWNIKMKIGKINIYISIGNNYKIKSRKLVILEKSGKKYVFNDKNLPKNKLKINNKIIPVKHSFPLENKVNQFIDFVKSEKENSKLNFMLEDINLSLKIANCIELINTHNN